ncbi:MAG: sulfatase-like hydrolase/transferase [Zoogloea sp.]|uniref:sulfatase-like hydrolase/transferase n=1 Tax=Zoogloea sp. TaxID=49181 RepID=UPI003F2C3E81
MAPGINSSLAQGKTSRKTAIFISEHSRQSEVPNSLTSQHEVVPRRTNHITNALLHTSIKIFKIVRNAHSHQQLNEPTTAHIIERLLLIAASLTPTIFALLRAGTSPHKMLQPTLWGVLASMIIGCLPWPAFTVTRTIIRISLPFFLWWIGYVSMNGIGPGWEAGVAALSSYPAEIFAALHLALSQPGCGITCALFITLLWANQLPHLQALHLRSSPLNPIFSKARPYALTTGLMGFSISAISSNINFSLPLYFDASAQFFSPLGSLSVLGQTLLHRIASGDLYLTPPKRHTPPFTKTHTEPELAVLVIGESMRAGGIGPQTIDRGPWSRALIQRVEQGLGAWAPTTCAGSYATHLSVPLMLTGLPPARFEESLTAPSVLGVLKSAGFLTAWISNQDLRVFQESGHDLYWSGGTVDSSFDENVAPVLQAFSAPLQTRNSNIQPRASVIHLAGSHFKYQDRYPATEFAPEPNNLSAESETTLRYERSEEYTAKVLLQLANILDQTPYPAFLLYSSDHGENLPGDKNGLVAHLGGRASIHDGTTITAFFWNKAFLETGRTQTLKHLLTAPLISHTDIAPAFLTLAGVKPSTSELRPAAAPQILAPVEVGQRSAPHFCSDLKP